MTDMSNNVRRLATEAERGHAAAVERVQPDLTITTTTNEGHPDRLATAQHLDIGTAKRVPSPTVGRVVSA